MRIEGKVIFFENEEIIEEARLLGFEPELNTMTNQEVLTTSEYAAARKSLRLKHGADERGILQNPVQYGFSKPEPTDETPEPDVRKPKNISLLNTNNEQIEELPEDARMIIRGFEKIVRETEKAYLLGFGTGIEQWIPKSVIVAQVFHETIKSRSGIAVKTWFGKKFGSGSIAAPVNKFGEIS